MENDFYTQERQAEMGGAALTLGRYTAKTFLIMFLGLMVTFGTAILLGATDIGRLLLFYSFTEIPYFHVILLVAQLAVVLGLSAMLNKMSAATAGVLFFVYALVTGITFGSYFFIFDAVSLGLAFGAAALYFGGMAVFGYVTRIDLTRIRVILIGGLIFLVVLNVLMLFIPGLAALERVGCTVGVLIFLGLTAYDTQKIKGLYYAYSSDEVMLKKAGIISALQLYLDFINLFLYLLRFLNRSKK